MKDARVQYILDLDRTGKTQSWYRIKHRIALTRERETNPRKAGVNFMFNATVAGR